VLDTGGMSKAQQERREFWRQLIAQQEQNGVTVRALCQHGVSEYSFYQWRKRLAEQLPVKFALVETNRSVPAGAGVEVILATGERLRIASGTDAATVRLALSILREAR
jgi:transposase-like protein